MDEWDKYIRTTFPDKHAGTQVTIEYVPFGDYFKKYLSSVAANDVPDVLHSSIIWGRDFYDLGTVVELNDYMKTTPDMDPKGQIPVTTLYNQKGGKYYGASWEGPDGGCIYYNVDMFKQAGLDPAYEKTKKWSWDDLVTSAQKLTKRTGDQVDVAGYLVHVPWTASFASWLYCLGGKYYADDVQSKTAFAADDKGAQSVQLYLDLLNKYKVSLPLSADRQDLDLFYQGKAAMLYGGLWAVSKFETDAPNLKFDLMPQPQGPGGQGKTTTVFANMHLVPSASKNKDTGWDFITWYCSLDSAIAKLKIQGMPSTRKDFYETKEWKDAVAKIPQRAHVPDIADTGDIYPFARYTRVDSLSNPVYESMLLGKVDPKKALADLQPKIDQVLAAPPQS